MDATDTAGAVVSQANWNNAPGRAGVTADIAGTTAADTPMSQTGEPVVAFSLVVTEFSTESGWQFRLE